MDLPVFGSGFFPVNLSTASISFTSASDLRNRAKLMTARAPKISAEGARF
jgi:hypothetical protein